MMRNRRISRFARICLGVVGSCALAVILVSHFTDINLASLGGNATVVTAFAVGVLGIVIGIAADILWARTADRRADPRLRTPSRRSGRCPAAGRDVLRSDRIAAAGRLMLVVASLMPAAAGRRWLAEADSFLFEATPEQRALVSRNYLITAPQVIADAWAGHLASRARLAVTARIRTGHPDD